MKNLMMAAALCAGMMSANAQSTPTAPKTAPAENKTTATTPQKPMAHTDCLMSTDADWKALGLTADQMTKVKAIQDEHKKSCAAMKDESGMKHDDASKAAMVDAHEARIKEVLTPAQYDSWKKQCMAMATPAKPMEKK